MRRTWWKEAVIYQIYPASFYDSNGDGIGDISGIIEKLDYIKDLGVDVVWLSPIYQSPNHDNGYDISDYYNIMDKFGTMADFDRLLTEIHKRGLKLVMDLVVNHTSDEHKWFVESRLSKDNPRRDFYIWRKAKGGRKPNNWLSRFSGSAWEFDEQTGEYYLHIFSKKQPDLNWKNPDVKREIFKMMDWWLKKGIDGFRMDVINFIGKAEGLPDSKGINSPEQYTNQPLVHEILQAMNREILSKYDIMTVGETPHVKPADGILYVQSERQELDMIFHFEHVYLANLSGDNFIKYKEIQKKWYQVMKNDGWNSQYLANHDCPRSVSKYGNDQEQRVESAKMLATMLLTLPGTPYIYQGEEIGMTNVKFPRIGDYKDIRTVNKYKEELNKYRDPEEVLKELQPISRDNGRTPMQWDSSKHAGFTIGIPWLKVNPNYKEINVEKSLSNQDSVLNYYKKLIFLRKQHEALIYGAYHPLLEDDREIYAYLRELNGEKILVILNNSLKGKGFHCRQIDLSKRELLIANLPVAEDKAGNLILRPYEARLYKINT